LLAEQVRQGSSTSSTGVRDSIYDLVRASTAIASSAVVTLPILPIRIVSVSS